MFNSIEMFSNCLKLNFYLQKRSRFYHSYFPLFYKKKNTITHKNKSIYQSKYFSSSASNVIPISMLKHLPQHDEYTDKWGLNIHDLLRTDNRRMIVIDDNGSGASTVHDTEILFDYSIERIEKKLLNDDNLFFIVANTRMMSEKNAEQVIETIINNLLIASNNIEYFKPLQIISRIDSTLRSHFPSNIDIIMKNEEMQYDGIIFAPCMFEWGRVTFNDTHYIEDIEGENLIPVGFTKYAHDSHLPYRSSNLRDWIIEKSQGRINSNNILSISLEDIRNGGAVTIQNKLEWVEQGQVVIVNALHKHDLDTFMLGLMLAEQHDGRRFVYCVGPSFIQSRLGVGMRYNQYDSKRKSVSIDSNIDNNIASSDLDQQIRRNKNNNKSSIYYKEYNNTPLLSRTQLQQLLQQKPLQSEFVSDVPNLAQQRVESSTIRRRLPNSNPNSKRVEQLSYNASVDDTSSSFWSWLFGSVTISKTPIDVNSIDDSSSALTTANNNTNINSNPNGTDGYSYASAVDLVTRVYRQRITRMTKNNSRNDINRHKDTGDIHKSYSLNKESTVIVNPDESGADKIKDVQSGSLFIVETSAQVDHLLQRLPLSGHNDEDKGSLVLHVHAAEVLWCPRPRLNALIDRLALRVGPALVEGRDVILRLFPLPVHTDIDADAEMHANGSNNAHKSSLHATSLPQSLSMGPSNHSTNNNSNQITQTSESGTSISRSMLSHFVADVVRAVHQKFNPVIIKGSENTVKDTTVDVDLPSSSTSLSPHQRCIPRFTLVMGAHAALAVADRGYEASSALVVGQVLSGVSFWQLTSSTVKTIATSIDEDINNISTEGCRMIPGMVVLPDNVLQEELLTRVADKLGVLLTEETRRVSSSSLSSSISAAMDTVGEKQRIAKQAIEDSYVKLMSSSTPNKDTMPQQSSPVSTSQLPTRSVYSELVRNISCAYKSTNNNMINKTLDNTASSMSTQPFPFIIGFDVESLEMAQAVISAVSLWPSVPLLLRIKLPTSGSDISAAELRAGQALKQSFFGLIQGLKYYDSDKNIVESTDGVDINHTISDVPDHAQIFTAIYADEDMSNIRAVVDSFVYRGTSNQKTISRGSVVEVQCHLYGPDFETPSSQELQDLANMEADVIEICIHNFGTISKDYTRSVNKADVKVKKNVNGNKSTAKEKLISKKSQNDLKHKLYQSLRTIMLACTEDERREGGSPESKAFALNLDTSSTGGSAISVILSLVDEPYPNNTDTITTDISKLPSPISRIHFSSDILGRQAMRVVKKHDSQVGKHLQDQHNEWSKRNNDYGQLTGSVFNSMRLAALDCLARLKPNSLR